MGTNRMFQGWDEANVALENLVGTQFYLKIIPPYDDDGASLMITLLPDYKIPDVPREYDQIFLDAYSEFLQDTNKLLGLRSYIQSLINNNRMMTTTQLEYKADLFISDWEYNHELNLRNVLKGYFGIPAFTGYKKRFKEILHEYEKD